MWAIHLELLHLPERVFLLWPRRDAAHVLFIFSLTRGVRTTLQTPDTNNTVMVRGRSSRTLIVCAGLWPFISVYCKQFFSLHLFWADAFLRTAVLWCNGFYYSSWLTNDLNVCFQCREHPPADNACCMLKRPSTYEMLLHTLICISLAVTTDLFCLIRRWDRFITMGQITEINMWCDYMYSTNFPPHYTFLLHQWIEINRNVAINR